MPPVRARKPIQSSELVGTPCRYSGGDARRLSAAVVDRRAGEFDRMLVDAHPAGEDNVRDRERESIRGSTPSRAHALPRRGARRPDLRAAGRRACSRPTRSCRTSAARSRTSRGRRPRRRARGARRRRRRRRLGRLAARPARARGGRRCRCSSSSRAVRRRSRRVTVDGAGERDLPDLRRDDRDRRARARRPRRGGDRELRPRCSSARTRWSGPRSAR